MGDQIDKLDREILEQENAKLRAEVEPLRDMQRAGTEEVLRLKAEIEKNRDAVLGAGILVNKLAAMELQNGELKRAIWKHLHIKHERTICPLSVGTPERCCEIIMRDAGLNPANGTPTEKPNPEPCGEVFDGDQKCLLPKPCRLHTEKRKCLHPPDRIGQDHLSWRCADCGEEITR